MLITNWFTGSQFVFRFASGRIHQPFPAAQIEPRTPNPEHRTSNPRTEREHEPRSENPEV
jgi:hypothetical protein